MGGLAPATIFIFFQTPQAAKPVDATIREKLLQMDPIGTALIMGAAISFILSFNTVAQGSLGALVSSLVSL